MLSSKEKLEWVLHVLGCYGISPIEVVALKPIKVGIENEVIRATVSSGAIIVRRHRKLSACAIEFECSILETIAGKCGGIATPVPLRTTEGQPYLRFEDHLFTAYKYIQGSHPVRFSSLLVRDLCGFARTLHEVAYPSQWVDEIGKFDWLQSEDLTRHFITENSAVLSRQQQQQLEKQLTEISEVTAILARFPRVIVHGDLHDGNILLDSTGRLSGVLDFDDACLNYSILEFTGIARGHSFNDDGSFLLEKCQTIYREAGVALSNSCSLDEFIQAVGMECFRNMLQIFQGNMTFQDRRLKEQRQMNQWASFSKLINISLYQNAQISK